MNGFDKLLEKEKNNKKHKAVKTPGSISLTCGHCKHSWGYKGKKIRHALKSSFSVYTSCPLCKSSVKIVPQEED